MKMHRINKTSWLLRGILTPLGPFTDPCPTWGRASERAKVARKVKARSTFIVWLVAKDMVFKASVWIALILHTGEIPLYNRTKSELSPALSTSATSGFYLPTQSHSHSGCLKILLLSAGTFAFWSRRLPQRFILIGAFPASSYLLFSLILEGEKKKKK